MSGVTVFDSVASGMFEILHGANCVTVSLM